MKNSCSNEPLSVSGKNTLIITLANTPKALNIWSKIACMCGSPVMEDLNRVDVDVVLVCKALDVQLGIFFIYINSAYPFLSFSSILFV